jgi:hypothetical protein
VNAPHFPLPTIRHRPQNDSRPALPRWGALGAGTFAQAGFCPGGRGEIPRPYRNVNGGQRCADEAPGDQETKIKPEGRRVSKPVEAGELDEVERDDPPVQFHCVPALR